MADRAARNAEPDSLTSEPRLFVAVPLDDHARTAVTEVVERVRAEEPRPPKGRRGVRWVRLDGLHLTLRFLGPTDATRVPALAAALGSVAAASRGFGVTIAGAGGFPSEARPRTIWLGLREGAEALADLARSVDAALEPLGWDRQDRPFRAHLTLARSDGVVAGPAVVRSLGQAMDRREIDSRIERIVLFESVTGGGPARYVSWHEVSLG